VSAEDLVSDLAACRDNEKFVSREWYSGQRILVFMANKDPVIISESAPLIIGDLTVYPGRLQYKNTRCNFSDIEHLGWRWFSQTTSFINARNVTFTIHMRRLPRPIHISTTTMHVTPKLVTAYNFIAQETVQARLLQYTQQLEQHGCFAIQGGTIYSDGRIQGKGDTFHLRNAEFEAFQMSVKQEGSFRPGLNLDLTVDKDVLFSVFRSILQNPQDPNHVRPAAGHKHRTRESADYFLVDTISMLAKLACADGPVSFDEIAAIKDFAGKALQLSPDRMKLVVSIFLTAKRSAEPFEFHARRLFQAHSKDVDLLRRMLDLLFAAAAMAHNKLSVEEELLLLEAEEIFGIAGPAFTSFRRAKKSERNAHGHAHQKSESECLRSLGLAMNVTPEEIKLKYRQLVMQYHPDRVYHLGPQFRSEAEMHIKRINIDYKCLCRKYGM